MPVELNLMPPVGPVPGQGGSSVGRAGRDPAGANLPPPPGSSPPPSDRRRPVSEAAVHEAVRQLNQHIQAVRRDLQFSVDKETGRTVVKIVDVNTKEVIRQIPSEDVLSLDHRLQQLAGILLRARA